jgi:hypothetical protein
MGFQAGTPNLGFEVSCVLVEEAVFPKAKMSAAKEHAEIEECSSRSSCEQSLRIYRVRLRRLWFWRERGSISTA